MTTLLALAAVALLFVVFGLLPQRAVHGGSCRRCPADELPELCAACPLHDSAASEEEVRDGS